MRISKLALASLLMAAASGAQAQIVTNGGFETGNFTGWTVTPAASGSDLSVQSNFPHSGRYYARFGAIGTTDDRISQTLSTTAGNNYSLDFFLRLDGNTNNDFSASVNGVALVSLTNSSAFNYTEFTAPFVGTGSDTLTFAARNFPSFTRLDDITVTDLGPAAVPEPGSIAMLVGMGISGAGFLARRRRSARKAA